MIVVVKGGEGGRKAVVGRRGEGAAAAASSSEGEGEGEEEGAAKVGRAG